MSQRLVNEKMAFHSNQNVLTMNDVGRNSTRGFSPRKNNNPFSVWNAPINSSNSHK